MVKIWCLILILVAGSLAAAEQIRFPEEELARETVLPVFDKTRDVLDRNVVTAGQLEFGVGGGMEINEPYYNDLMLSAMGAYNFTNTSALNVQGLFWMPGLSSYGEQLKPGDPTSSPPREAFDASKAPHPAWAVFGNYQFTAYYGKISLSKETVMNLDLFGLAGLGYLNLNQLNTVALDLGLGQDLYFTRHLALRFDLRWVIFQGPNPPSERLTSLDNPSPSSFGQRIFYNTQLGLSLVFLQ